MIETKNVLPGRNPEWYPVYRLKLLKPDQMELLAEVTKYPGLLKSSFRLTRALGMPRVVLTRSLSELCGVLGADRWEATELYQRFTDVQVPTDSATVEQVMTIDYSLAPKEEKILKLAALGFSVQETANTLNTGVENIKNVRTRILNKMTAPTMVEAVIKGIDTGKIDPEELVEGYDITRFDNLTISELVLLATLVEQARRDLADKTVKNRIADLYKKIGINPNRARLAGLFRSYQIFLEQADVPKTTETKQQLAFLTYDQLRLIEALIAGTRLGDSSNRYIADIMGLPVSTIKRRLYDIFAVLGVNSRYELASKYLTNRLPTQINNNQNGVY
ncbi:hypothetical protein HY025_06010 [Candidatus Daviesbacteria bacterium]|nr:hypothetical protein [Candidatus Daviesbacteria bacterium]